MKYIKLISASLVGLFVLSGCAGKSTKIQAYQNGVLEPNKIREINLETKTSRQLEQNLLNRVPIRVMGDTLLSLNKEAPITVRVTEYDSEIINKPSLRNHTSYYYPNRKKNKKHRIPVRYQEFCLNTTYIVKTQVEIFEYTDMINSRVFQAIKSNSKCRNNKSTMSDYARQDYQFQVQQANVRNTIQNNVSNSKNVIINNNITTNVYQKQRIRNNNVNNLKNIVPLDFSNYYNGLANRVASDIISYIAPSTRVLTVYFEDELDIEIPDKEEDKYEDLVEKIQNNNAPILEKKLLTFLKKYPHSYTMNYNIGIYYEKQSNYDLATYYYNQASKIKITDKVLQRLNVVNSQKNIKENLEN